MQLIRRSACRPCAFCTGCSFAAPCPVRAPRTQPIRCAAQCPFALLWALHIRPAVRTVRAPRVLPIRRVARMLSLRCIRYPCATRTTCAPHSFAMSRAMLFTKSSAKHSLSIRQVARRELFSKSRVEHSLPVHQVAHQAFADDSPSLAPSIRCQFAKSRAGHSMSCAKSRAEDSLLIC